MTGTENWLYMGWWDSRQDTHQARVTIMSTISNVLNKRTKWYLT